IAGNDGTVIRTTNGGNTWVQQDIGITNRDIYDIQFVNNNTGWVVGQNGTIRKTIDGGATWTAQSTSGQTLYGAYFVDANTGWAVGNSGTIRKTTDGGTTWVDQSGPDPVDNQRYMEVHFISATTGWIVGNNGTILFTTNGGTTWTQQYSNYNSSINSVYFVNGMYGWSVGNDGTVQSYLSVTLPVNFASFEAGSTDCNTARLQWQTAGDASNHQVEILWSPNGSNWKTVGTVKATSATNYSYNYTGLTQGTNYFKLKEIAQDGQAVYSRSVTVSKTCGVTAQVSVYPNPAIGNITVELKNADLLGTQARLVNMQGNVLRQFTINKVQESINMTGLPAGTYFLITASKQPIKIVKQ
ncbi:MAG TPA: YCF48-related protein, partial [Niastella sp.]